MTPLKEPKTDAEWQQWVRDANRRLAELEILESATVKRNQLSSGVILEVKPSVTSGGGEATLPVWL